MASPRPRQSTVSTAHALVALTVATVAMATLTSCTQRHCPDELMPWELVDADGAQPLCLREASSEAERRMGLIGAPAPEEGEGLLIHFPVTGEACISNADVDYSIHIAFLDESFRAHRVEATVPAGSGTLYCTDKTAHVLELSAQSQAPTVGSTLRRD